MAKSPTAADAKCATDNFAEKLLKSQFLQLEKLPGDFPVKLLKASDGPPKSKQLPASDQVTPSAVGVLEAIQNSDLQTIEATCQNYNRSFPSSVSDIYAEWNGVWETPLHVAVTRKDLAILEYLLDCQNFAAELIERRFWDVVHTFVQNTWNQNDENLKQTVVVLRRLAKINVGLLNAQNEDGVIPLMLLDVHPALIIEMASHGCDLTFTSSDPRTPTVFHLAATYFTSSQFDDLVKEAKAENLETCFSKLDSLGRSPLHIAVANFEVKEETLDALLGLVNLNMRDVDNKTVLFQAVEAGKSTTLLKSLVNRGATAGATISEGNNVIHCAISKGLGADIVEFLCKSFPEQVNQKNKKGLTPISLALVTAAPDSIQVVQVLVTVIKVKVDQIPNIELFQMGWQDRWQVFKFLVRHGYLIDSEENNAVHKAPENVTIKEFHDIVLEFVKSGKEHISAQNKLGQVPLHRAVLHLDVQEKTLNLFRTPDFKAVDEKGKSVLFFAIEGGRDVKFIQSLLKRGAEGEKVNAGGDNIVHWSVRHANMAPTKYLGRRFRSLLNQKNIDGLTALRLLLKCEHVSLEWVKLLVELGEDVKDIPYMDVLQMAGRDKLKVIEFLVEKGLNVFAVDHLGKNVLHLAVKSGNVEAVKYFVNQCANLINAKTSGGATPLEMALHEDRDMREIVEALIRRGAKVETIPEMMLLKAKCKNKWDVVTVFIRNGYKIGNVDGKGWNLLEAANRLSPEQFHFAALSCVEAGRPQMLKATDGSSAAYSVLHRVLMRIEPLRETLELFKNHGVDFNYKSLCGGKPDYSSFLLAYYYGRSFACLKQLVEFGADCTLPRFQGYTSLHRAANSCEDDIVEFLVEKGADVNAICNNISPLHFAVMNPVCDTLKRFKIVELLVNKGASVNAKNNQGLTPLAFGIKQRIVDDATLNLLK